jgi:DNA helicase-2/ATP-dependent DNA helicase PcrA
MVKSDNGVRELGSMVAEVPVLKGQALEAVRHRGSHLQIIACAGAGKTEVVAQRVADLFADGVDPSGVVAFTFTERAGESLKTRIGQRVEARLGTEFLDSLNACFVGTIHSYCLHLLQEHVPRYDTYDLLDEHRLAAFLTRESNAIGVKDLTGQLFASIKAFVQNAEVVENELLQPGHLRPPFRDMVARFYELLGEYRLLTYGQMISRAVGELDNPRVFAAVHDKLRHLIVDEYQDINPAQEALICRLAHPPVELCVVGDDDQSIYQWRGSDVGNIVTFRDRYPNVAKFEITVNRRSRPRIIEVANNFGTTIKGRLPKTMQPHRERAGTEVVTWRKPTEASEADLIARSVQRFRALGHQYRGMAVLVRSSTSYARLMEAFQHHRIPVQPGGRTGLFREPESRLFGRTFAYLANQTWRDGEYGNTTAVHLPDLVRDYQDLFSLEPGAQQRVRKRLEGWRTEVDNPTHPANLIGEYYELLRDCGVAAWDLSDPLTANRLGILARCSAILADYESIRRRSRPDPSAPGEVVGGQDRGTHYYFWLAIHIQNWAAGAYEGFEGEEDIGLDAIDLTTIHKAKGLEWPIVFVPCVTASRFPPRRTGTPGNWFVPRGSFDHRRYEGSENDERRLFYVAITRARDWLSVSSHDTPNKQRVSPSPFILKLGGQPPLLDKLPEPASPERADESEPLLSITFSELADFALCGLAYRLRNVLGFQPPIAPELGYGKAVHHVLREVAEHTRRYGKVPNAQQMERLFDDSFFLPAASKPAHRLMKSAAKKLVARYLDVYSEDLKRVWAVERPFELHLPNAVLSGRADVILDEEDSVVSSLAIVDYKTAAKPEYDHDLQLQVYADAGRREGLTVRASYVHDLHAGDRISVDVSDSAVAAAEDKVVHLLDRIRQKDFAPHPDGHKCSRCDVRPMCRFAA